MLLNSAKKTFFFSFHLFLPAQDDNADCRNEQIEGNPKVVPDIVDALERQSIDNEAADK